MNATDQHRPMEHTESPGEDTFLAVQDQLALAFELGRMGTWEWEIAADRVRWNATLERVFRLVDAGTPVIIRV